MHVHAKTMGMMGVCVCVYWEAGRGGGGMEDKLFLTFTQVNSIVYMWQVLLDGDKSSYICGNLSLKASVNPSSL